MQNDRLNNQNLDINKHDYINICGYKRRKGGEKMKKTLCITLPVDMVGELVEIAKLSKRTLSSQIEMIVEEELKRMRENEKKKSK